MTIYADLLAGRPSAHRAEDFTGVAEAVGLGGPLPTSYVDFARNWGYGRTLGEFLIYIPMGDYPDSLTLRSAYFTEVNAEFIADYIEEEETEGDCFELKPDGTPEIAASLVPFGMSENGEILCWARGHASEESELDIYVIGARMCGMTYGGPNLRSFLADCTTQEVKKRIGPGWDPLPATFEPLEKVEE